MNPCLFQLLVAASFDSWLHHISLPSSSRGLLVSVSSLTRTLVIGFRAHLDNPEYSHLKIFNLITSMKTIFPKKVIHGFQADVSFAGKRGYHSTHYN